MKKALVIFVMIASSISVNSQTIYSKAFGDSKDKALIFLHGGPGYNSVNFETTTAEKLSEKGFYVITYDRRGEGRSLDEKASFTFEETLNDLNYILDKYNIESTTLIGHSFGGVIATLFAKKFPEKIDSVVYVGAPFSMQDTFSTIIKSSKTIYQAQKDSINLNYISMLEKMDKTTLQYSSYCFAHAMQNGFYRTKNITKEAASIYKTFKTDSLLIKYSSQMTYAAPQGFWKNENYTTLDLRKNLEQLVNNGIPIFGLYGKEDGLFSDKQIKNIRTIIGQNNLKYIDNCSHNVFIDQQSKFINSLIEWTKSLH